MINRHPLICTLILGILCLGAPGCAEPNTPENLSAQSALSYSMAESEVRSIPMNGYVEFEERVELAAVTSETDCYFATYEFRFDYDTSVFVEFRDGLEGFCSFGAVLTRSFGMHIIAEEEFPVGTKLEPLIQFQQKNSHNAIFQIGAEYYVERVGDLRTVEISCRRNSCDGSVERRQANAPVGNPSSQRLESRLHKLATVQ